MNKLITKSEEYPMIMPSDNVTIEIKPDFTVKNEPIVLICAADDNYAMQLAVTGRSALVNLQGDRQILLFIIDGGIKTHNKQKILKSLNSERCEVKFLPQPDSLLGNDIEEVNKRLGPDGKTIAKYVSIAAFFRLLIPEILPNELEKAIYLDCDLVVRGNLEQLWQTDLGDNYVLAAQDSWIPYVSNPNGLLNYKELKISSDSKYFNSGVLVINLKKWRTDNISAKAINYLKQKTEYVRWHDQDVLNALFAGQWGEVDPRWNCSPISVYGFSSWKDSPFTEEVYNNLIRDPYIIHYVSNKKPWTSRHTLLKEYFFEYVDMTAWSGWRLTIWRRFWLRLIHEFKKAISMMNTKSTLFTLINEKLKGIFATAVSWPSLEKEMGEYIHYLKGNVLNAGSGVPVGSRDFSKYVQGTLYNQDIFQHELIQITSPLHNIPFPDAFFNTIICNAVLEHVDNPKEVIQELSRVAKSGGYLYLCVPFMQPEHLIPTDFQRYTIDGLKKLVTDAGFEVEKAEGIHTVYHTIGWIMQEWLKPKKELKYKMLQVILFPLIRYLSSHSTEYVHSVASTYRVWAKRV